MYSLLLQHEYHSKAQHSIELVIAMTLFLRYRNRLYEIIAIMLMPSCFTKVYYTASQHHYFQSTSSLLLVLLIAVHYKLLPSIAPQAMQRLASCITRGKRVSSVAFDCTSDHAALGILHYPSEMGEFGCLCTSDHAALGIVRYRSQAGEFNCLQLHPRLG